MAGVVGSRARRSLSAWGPTTAAGASQRTECVRGHAALALVVAALLAIAEGGLGAANLEATPTNMARGVLRLACGLLAACTVALWWVDPGFLRPGEPGHPDAAKWKAEGGPKCPQCDVQRPPVAEGAQWRTHHCSVCGLCCRDHEHHCNILGRCISRRTLPLFVGVNFTGAVAALSWGLCMRAAAYHQASARWPDGAPWTTWLAFHAVVEPIFVATLCVALFLLLFGLVHVVPVDDAIAAEEPSDEEDASAFAFLTKNVCVRLVVLTFRVLVAAGRVGLARYVPMKKAKV